MNYASTLLCLKRLSRMQLRVQETSTKTDDHFISMAILIFLHLKYVLCNMYDKVNIKVSLVLSEHHGPD